MSTKLQFSSTRPPQAPKGDAAHINTGAALPAKYQAILRAPHWEPHTHLRMSRQARAAQFSPFAALTGFYDEIEAKRTELAQRRDTEIVRESEPWPGDDCAGEERQENLITPENWDDPENSSQSP